MTTTEKCTINTQMSYIVYIPGCILSWKEDGGTMVQNYYNKRSTKNAFLLHPCFILLVTKGLSEAERTGKRALEKKYSSLQNWMEVLGASQQSKKGSFSSI